MGAGPEEMGPMVDLCSPDGTVGRGKEGAAEDTGQGGGASGGGALSLCDGLLDGL